MVVQRSHLFPGLAPVAAAEEHGRFAAGVNRARFIGGAGLNPPDALQRSLRQGLHLQAGFGQLPGFAAIGAGVDVRAEPGAVYGGVKALGFARILRHMVDFPSGKKRALDIPLLAVAGAEHERAFARAGPDGDGRGLCHRVNHKTAERSFERKIALCAVYVSSLATLFTQKSISF